MALLDNPNDRDEGREAAACKGTGAEQFFCTPAARKLQEGSNYGVSRWQTHSKWIGCRKPALPFVTNSATTLQNIIPAKLNNFSLTGEQVDELSEQIALVKTVAEYVTFKTDCSAVVDYIANIRVP